MKIVGTSSEQIANGEHVSVDIERLVESIEQKLSGRPFSDKCSIYRVPKRLRKLNEQAYTPRVISIGPLHHGKEELKDMEEHKRLYLKEFLELSDQVSLKDFTEAIAERERRVRNSYAETFENIGKEEFIEMTLLDCSFVIMSLLKKSDFPFPQINIDRIFHKPWMFRDIRFDLILLENQLPFFILEDLLELSKIKHYGNKYSMINLTHNFLRRCWHMWVPEDILEKINTHQVRHFVDFLIICQLPAQLQSPPTQLDILTTQLQSPPKRLRNFVDFLRICHLPIQQSPSTQIDTVTTPTAAELRSAGIKFKFVCSPNILDIKFDVDKGTLEIPRFLIHRDTERFFRNLQAFEQCDYGIGYVGDYIVMLFWLVRAAKDVDVLVKYGIVENVLDNSDVVSKLLRNLVQEVPINPYSIFSGVVEDLNNYYGKRRNKWKADLEQKYFESPWTSISVVAAAILLILTLIQTVCSILQVKFK